ncbi:unnamed protein product [Soboliphyme baturini]|uniref:AMP-binding domain-containing protein n=1 Tax=Soboliphyme baturini TaxID=241478 RepID=A0A183IMS4_9BILA|nr:unnamed protein product [Soboliphyme baturini]
MFNESISKPGFNDAIIAFLPFFHIYGIYMLFTGLKMGQNLIIMPRFKLSSFLQLIQTFKARYLYIVPPILKYLLEDPSVENYDITSVEYLMVGGAHLGTEITNHALAKFPHILSIQQGYGMTETSCASHIVPIHPIQRRKGGSCGVIMPNFECKVNNTAIQLILTAIFYVIDTATGEELHEFQTGEICVRGETCCLGYYQDAEATDQLFDSKKWLHTGDIGYFDDEKFFYIVERKKDLIKVNCFQVSPTELEDLLVKHEQILDAAVVGIPDQDTEETPYAFVVPSDDSLSADDVILFLNGM